MPRLYRDLRGRLMAEGLDGPYLASKLGVHPNTLSRAFTGKRSWTLAECYKILEMLNEPVDRLPVLFPKEGRKS